MPGLMLSVMMPDWIRNSVAMKHTISEEAPPWVWSGCQCGHCVGQSMADLHRTWTAFTRVSSQWRELWSSCGPDQACSTWLPRSCSTGTKWQQWLTRPQCSTHDHAFTELYAVCVYVCAAECVIVAFNLGPCDTVRTRGTCH